MATAQLQQVYGSGAVAWPAVPGRAVWAGVPRWLFLPALLALFIPIPRLGLPVSPENLLYVAFFALLLARRMPAGFRVPRTVRALGWLTVLFMIAQYAIKGWFLGRPVAEPMLLRRALLLGMACAAICDERHFRVAAACVVAGMLVSGVVGLFTVFQIEPVASLYERFLELGVEDLDVLEHRADLATRRLMGLRGTVYGFSYLTAPVFLLLAGFVTTALRRGQAFRALLSLVAMGLVLFCMLLNAERSSFLALAVGLAVWLAQVRRVDGLVLAIAPLAVGGMALTAWNDTLLAHRDNDRDNLLYRIQQHDSGEFAGRIGLALGGALTVLDHPLTGGTAEDYQQRAGELPLVTRFFMNKGLLPASHNSYVNAGMRAGMAGWLLLAGILAVAVRLLRLAVRHTRGRAGADPLVAAVRAGFIACLVNAFFHNQGVLSGEPMTWALLALGASALAAPHWRPAPAGRAPA